MKYEQRQKHTKQERDDYRDGGSETYSQNFAEAFAEAEADRPIREGPRKTNSMNVICLWVMRLV